MDILDGTLTRISLRETRWNVNRDIPERLISTLEKQWPSVKLSAENHDRELTDTRLLSSPLLQFLSFGTVNGRTSCGFSDGLAHYSKLPELKAILLMIPHLRKLNVRFRYNWRRRQIEWLGFTATPHISDQIPALPISRLSGPDETYENVESNCQLSIQCRDWGRFRGFAVRISYPHYLFDDMWDCVHQKPLTIAEEVTDRREDWCTYLPRGDFTGKNLYTVVDFIEPIPDAEVPHPTDLDSAAAKIASAITETRHRFETFLSRAPKTQSSSRYYEWTPEQLQHLHQQALELQHFKIEFTLLGGKWVRINIP